MKPKTCTVLRHQMFTSNTSRGSEGIAVFVHDSHNVAKDQTLQSIIFIEIFHNSGHIIVGMIYERLKSQTSSSLTTQ